METGEKKEITWRDIETPSANGNSGEIVLQVKGSVEDVARFIERMMNVKYE